MLKKFKLEPIFLTLLIYIIIVVSYGVYSYLSARSNYLDRVKEKLICIAENIDRILPENFHDKAIAHESVSTDENSRNAEILSSFVEKIGILKVFTAIIRDGKVFITSSSNNNIESKDIAPYFQEYFGNKKLIKKCLFLKKTVFSEKEGNGTVYSICLPRKTKKGRQYVVYAGMNFTEIKNKLKFFFWRSFIISCIFIILAIPFMIAHMYSTKEHIEAFQDLREILHNKTSDRTAKMDQKIQDIIKKK